MSTVHDVRAARADRPLYEQLYGCTAVVAAQLFRDKTAQNAAGLLLDELAGLRDFLNEEDAGVVRENVGVRRDLAEHLERELAKPEQLDDSAETLAKEFARALWSSLLRQMRRNADGDKRISAEDLVPSESAQVEAQQWRELAQALEPFGVTVDEARLVVREVLADLRDSHSDESRIMFPLGLWTDRATLDACLAGRAPAQVHEAAHSRGFLRTLLGL